MKTLLSLIAIIVLGASLSQAHGGRLDKNGGHRDNSDGTYHKHR